MTEQLPTRIPIFPLPNTVLFPGVVLPLHVFEPRYRQLVAEHLIGTRVLGVVLLEPGKEYEATPPAYRVGCAGPMEDVSKLPDGRYTLTVVPKWKFEVVRYLQREPYRVAEVRELDERAADESLVSTQQSRTRLLGAYTSLAAAFEGRPSNPFSFDSSLDYARIVNLACMHLGIAAEEKQRLLELHDVDERGRRIIRMLEQEHRRILKLQEIDGSESGPIH